MRPTRQPSQQALLTLCGLFCCITPTFEGSFRKKKRPRPRLLTWHGRPFLVFPPISLTPNVLLYSYVWKMTVLDQLLTCRTPRELLNLEHLIPEAFPNLDYKLLLSELSESEIETPPVLLWTVFLCWKVASNNCFYHLSFPVSVGSCVGWKVEGRAREDCAPWRSLCCPQGGFGCSTQKADGGLRNKDEANNHKRRPVEKGKCTNITVQILTYNCYAIHTWAADCCMGRGQFWKSWWGEVEFFPALGCLLNSLWMEGHEL